MTTRCAGRRPKPGVVRGSLAQRSGAPHRRDFWNSTALPAFAGLRGSAEPPCVAAGPRTRRVPRKGPVQSGADAPHRRRTGGDRLRLRATAVVEGPAVLELQSNKSNGPRRQADRPRARRPGRIHLHTPWQVVSLCQPPQPKGVAKLTSTADCLWADGNAVTKEGASLLPAKRSN